MTSLGLAKVVYMHVRAWECRRKGAMQSCPAALNLGVVQGAEPGCACPGCRSAYKLCRCAKRALMPGPGQALYESVSGLRLCDGSLPVPGSVASRRWPALPDAYWSSLGVCP